MGQGYGWGSTVGAGLAVSLALASTPSPSEQPHPDIVVLVADGLRADLGDRVVRVVRGNGTGDVLIFERAYAPSSLPEQSLAALFTGRLPTHGGSIGLVEAQPSERATTLAASLRAAGYRTALVSQASWASRPGYTRGFGDLQTAPETGWDDDEVADRALGVLRDWGRLDRRAGQRPAYFLVAHWTTPRLAGKDLHDPEKARAAYAAAAEERLWSVGTFVQALETEGVLDDGALTLTSGSGFELLEHGDLGSGWTLDEQVVRVPLLVRLTGAQAGRVPDGDRSGAAQPVSSVRLASSLHALAGVEGRAFPQAPLPPLGGRRGAEPAVIAELVVRERAILRAAIVGIRRAGSSRPAALKYLRVLRDAPVADRDALENGYEELRDAMLRGATPSPPLFGDPKRELVLTLAADPGSLEEAAASLADVDERLPFLRRILDEYEGACERDGWPMPKLEEELAIDVDDAAQLEALGYL